MAKQKKVSIQETRKQIEQERNTYRAERIANEGIVARYVVIEFDPRRDTNFWLAETDDNHDILRSDDLWEVEATAGELQTWVIEYGDEDVKQMGVLDVVTGEIVIRA